MRMPATLFGVGLATEVLYRLLHEFAPAWTWDLEVSLLGSLTSLVSFLAPALLWVLVPLTRVLRGRTRHWLVPVFSAVAFYSTRPWLDSLWLFAVLVLAAPTLFWLLLPLVKFIARRARRGPG